MVQAEAQRRAALTGAAPALPTSNPFEPSS
jgi:hypothetical protein